ncbi:uncharacterized protein DUF2017 [Antricoccus suffuscus]|uniref:Uncharacterized protein DUF2017 n=1 Tax=Antricoccus suffuscus TaxID=1629062 RepID=A0A2T0Z2B3_9ACTN|nr:DUF2017 family protein [Antricoccus suffuscus]PRZ30492.1 uncharacterized protein DUF2017 [Antricoccus suffuscus]
MSAHLQLDHFSIDGERIGVHVDPHESELLSGLIGQVRALLIERGSEVGDSSAFAADDGADETAMLSALEHSLTPLPPPTDEVLARLLPSGRRDNAERAGGSAIEFRRLTEGDLRRSKIADADQALAVLTAGESGASLNSGEAQSLLRAINDVRLSLGARLDVTEDTPYPRSIRNEHDQALAIYFWTGSVQEELVTVLGAVG